MWWNCRESGDLSTPPPLPHRPGTPNTTRAFTPGLPPCHRASKRDTDTPGLSFHCGSHHVDGMLLQDSSTPSIPVRRIASPRSHRDRPTATRLFEQHQPPQLLCPAARPDRPRRTVASWTGLHRKLRVSLISGAPVVFWVSQPSLLLFPPFSSLSLPFLTPSLPFSHSFHPFPSFLLLFLLSFSLFPQFFNNFPSPSPIFLFSLLFQPNILFPTPFHRFLVKATRLFVTSLPALCRTRHLTHRILRRTRHVVTIRLRVPIRRKVIKKEGFTNSPNWDPCVFLVNSDDSQMREPRISLIRTLPTRGSYLG